MSAAYPLAAARREHAPFSMSFLNNPNPRKRTLPAPLVLESHAKRFCLRSCSPSQDESVPTSPELLSADSSHLDERCIITAAQNRFEQADVVYEHPTSPVSQEPPVSTPSPSGRGVDRFAKSRSVGQTHRDNEKNFSSEMEKDVDRLRVENVLLFAMLAVSTRLERRRALESSFAGARENMHRLSPEAASILGRSTLSGSMAVIMLELIAARRNLIAVTDDLHANRRRRRSSLVAASVPVVEKILSHGMDVLKGEGDTMGVAPRDWAEYCLDCLFDAHSAWAAYEKENGPPELDDDGDGISDSGQSGRFTKARPGEGPKRCSRCRKLKTAGSGHGRSKCDDHMLISSPIPYPAPPGTLDSVNGNRERSASTALSVK